MPSPPFILRGGGRPALEPLEPRLLLSADVILSEIMYQSPTDLGVPEDTGEEFLELHNRGDAPADLLGWELSSGVRFQFPDVTIDPGGYLVVAADPNVFHSLHPTVTNYIASGGWEGKLSNSGEEVTLRDASGDVADRVTYADEGDWAQRTTETDVYGATGYVWSNEHDGGGMSLELINPAMTNNAGANWAASLVAGGSPGGPNTVAAADIAPLIRDVRHAPDIPRPTDPVRVRAEIDDELSTGLTVLLHYRQDGDPDFDTLVMHDDGLHDDRDPGDGLYAAAIPAGIHPDGAVVEFYVEASDAAGLGRTWPAPVVGRGQVANALYQVDAAYDPVRTPGEPIEFRAILTAAEWAALDALEDDSATQDSNAQMNATFVVMDGTGTSVRYLAGMRNRGNGSRSHRPHNQRINLPHDAPWQGYTALNLNAQKPYSQVLGSAVFRYADVPAADATQVRLRINGTNHADTGDDMYGYYAWLEALDSEMVSNHWPDDDSGDLYKVNYYGSSSDDNELEYWGDDPSLYRRYFHKQTNVAADDYTGLLHMLDVLNNAPEATYYQDVSEAIDVEQWVRDLAIHDILGNREGGLLTGGGDDFAMYAGVEDPRFQLLPYDLDTVVNFGGTVDTDVLVRYRDVIGLQRLLAHPLIVQTYYAMLDELLDTVFRPDVIDPLVDTVLGGWRSEADRAATKQWIATRVANVRAQIPDGALSAEANLPTSGGVPVTAGPDVTFGGQFDVTGTRSITVNGLLAEIDPEQAAWSYDGSSAYSERTLVSAGGGVTWRVPAAADDPAAWREVGFDDSAWTDAYVVGGAGLLLTEVATDGKRFVEVQNVSRGPVNAAGWTVLLNDASGGIDAVNAVAWALPAEIAAGEVLYRTDDPADAYWGGPIDFSPTGPGWAAVVNEAGELADFVAWGYDATGIDALLGGSTFAGPAGDGAGWTGTGAAVGTTGGGPATDGWTACNDHVPGGGTHPNATSYSGNGTQSGLLTDIDTGEDLPVTLTIDAASDIHYAGSQDNPAAGTDAYAAFDGFVDLGSGDGASIELRASSAQHYRYTFSGLDTGDVVTYDFTGTAIRGNSDYTNRWTRVRLEGAVAATAAHSDGDIDGDGDSDAILILDAEGKGTEIALWTGDNSRVNQGFVAAWTAIDPGPDGEFSVYCEQYTGAVPTTIDPAGQADGSKGYAIGGIRLTEVAPSGPQSWLRRQGGTDGDSAADFARSSVDSLGVQNPAMDVPFGTVHPTRSAVGFDNASPSFADVIETDVGDALVGGTSLWTRQAFSGGELSGYDGLRLNVRYDDGFVAYLNGTEIASRNAPADPAWDASAGAERDDADAVVFETIDVSRFVSLLDVGDNVLAVHALDAPAGDAGMLIEAELIVSRGDPAAGLGLRPGLNRVRVRAFDGPYGTGNETDATAVDVWYDTGPTHIYPEPESPAAPTRAPEPPVATSAHLTVRDSYLPGVPVLVRVEVRDELGQIDRGLWDATAVLGCDNPAVTPDVSEVKIVNGLGTALVTFSGSGDFSLTATVAGLSDSDDLADLTGVAMTNVSGTLDDPSGTTTFSGVVHVTGGLTVPDGHTLRVEPGALVLIDGVASGTGGTVLTVEGDVQAVGTEDSPITFTAANAGENWGMVLFSGAEPSTFAYASLTRAGHSPGVGHSGTGPTIRASGGTLVLDHVNLTDEAGKAMHATGGIDLTFRDVVMARSVMGPEVTPSSLLVEDTWIVDMHYHDDADGIYVHGAAPGRAMMTGGVVAFVDDDGIDTLQADLTIEDYIVRDAFDKGVSVYDDEVTVRWSLIVDNATDSEDNTSSSISAKAYANHSVTVNLDHVTVRGVRQAGTTDVGIEARWKFGDATPVTITYNVSNCIIDATRSVKNDYADDPASTLAFNIDYSNLYGTGFAGGVGNLNADPQFVDPDAGDFRLAAGSPSIDAGDPTFTLDQDGTITDQGRFTNNASGSGEVPVGALDADTVWGPDDGQFRVEGELTVPEGVTLTILPGTTVFFDTHARLIVGGTLDARGTAEAPIRLTRTPGVGSWDGIHFVDSAGGNVIRHAIIEHARPWEPPAEPEGAISLSASSLTLEDSLLDHIDLWRIVAEDSSLTVRGCTFADLAPPGQGPTTDNRSEHIKARGIAVGGAFLIEGNTFGRTPGHNDAIDYDGPARPGPVARIVGNTFLGGGDDALDLEGGAHVEGNAFLHYAKDAWNSDPGESNVLSAGGGYDYVLVRNGFAGCDHAVLVKEGAFLTFAGNTVFQCAGAAVYFDLPGQTSGPGEGATVVDSIFAETPDVFAEILPGTVLSLDYSLVPEALLGWGTGNVAGDARLADPAGGDFALRPGSAGEAAGQFGADLGCAVPGGAHVSAGPHDLTWRDAPAFQAGGNAVEAVRWRLDGGAWSADLSPGSTIALTDLADGTHMLEVIARDSAGVWQTEADATVRQWTQDGALARVLIHEVLALNASAVEHDGLFPDVIELLNDSAAAVDLGGMSITDDPEEPGKHVFAAGTTIPAGGLLCVYAADPPAAGATGVYVGFQLDGDGEGVWLYDAAGELVDAVEFGTQVPDLSIGRVGRDRHWALTVPTPASDNLPQPVADPEGVVINEWFANGDIVLRDDFIELYNPDALPVDLAGLYLTDNPANQKTKHRLGPLSFIAGEGFRALRADDSGRSGHVDFRLRANMEILGLFDGDLAPMDRIYYVPQTTDVSQGRWPDGGDAVQFFSLPTPGVGNITRGTASNVEQTLVAGDAAKDVLVPTGDIGTGWRSELIYDTAGWTPLSGSPGGVGFDENTGYLPHIGLNTGSQMNQDLGAPADRNTCYVRVPFPFSGDPGDVDALTLSVQYDDGFLAYLNGTLIASDNAPASPAWDSTAASDHSDSEAVTFVPFDVTAYADLLVTGENLLAVHAMDGPDTSSDFLFNAELTAMATTWNGSPFAGLLDLHAALRVTELMYNPDGSDDKEFIELCNTGESLLDLSGVRLDDGIEFVIPEGTTLGAGEYLVVARDVEAFEDWYGPGLPVVGGYDPAGLSNSGEGVVLRMPAPHDAAILRFDFDDDWYISTDGEGPSLTIVDPAGRRAWWDDGDRWSPSSVSGGSPGAGDPDAQYPLGAVVVNEVLAHSDDPVREDWIELHNTTAADIDVGGWFLSDDPAQPLKYTIAEGTILPAGGFLTFTEADNFGPDTGDPGSAEAFALSEHGDEVVLTSADVTGLPSTYKTFAQFGATANGVTVGRHVSSNGGVDFTALSTETYAAANSAPLVGPVVLDEVMYHPADGELEYVILRNVGDADMPLYDPANPANTWRLSEGLLFDFPEGVVLPGGGSLLVVGVDPAVYRAQYAVPDAVAVFGPWEGALSNAGEELTLARPGTPETDPVPFVPYIDADAVRYGDDAPWPAEPDGSGPALGRAALTGYGSDPATWSAIPRPAMVDESFARAGGDACMPEITLRFAAAVHVSADGAALLDEAGQPVAAGLTVAGDGTDALTVTFAAPLAYGGPYTLRFAEGAVADRAGRTPPTWTGDVTFAAAVPGDVDFDGKVTGRDYLAVKRSFGRAVTEWSPADLDRSGTVDRDDLAVLRANLGAEYVPPPAPTTAETDAQAAPLATAPTATASAEPMPTGEVRDTPALPADDAPADAVAELPPPASPTAEEPLGATGDSVPGGTIEAEPSARPLAESDGEETADSAELTDVADALAGPALDAFAA